jgi:alpha-beta hydrolase superfamily lysophospholipase
MGEHLGRYEKNVIPHLLNHQISVFAYDQFGHGKTTGKRGHNPGFELVLDCVGYVSKKAQKLFPEVPVFLYGHSMGGNIVLNYVLRRPHHFKGVIASSPFLKLAFEPPKWKLALGKILGKVAPSMTMTNELNPNDISRIPEEVSAYSNDPLVHNKISANYSIKFIETGQWALDHASNLKIPVLLLHGTGDKIIDYKATEFFAKNSNSLATLALFKDGYHELHHDLCREEFLTTITEWINQQLKPKVE